MAKKQVQAVQEEPERWKPVAGSNGAYEVSTHGRVKSLPRKARTASGFRYLQEKILKPSMSTCLRTGNKYSSHVMLSLDGNKSRTKQIARLVLEAFVGPCPAGMEAVHQDGNSSNNHLSNLKWGKADKRPNKYVSRKRKK